VTIGIFDSGIGGFSVLQAIRVRLPQEPILYFADQAHVPYGRRPATEVRAFSQQITRFLLRRQAKLIVVACNTASAAALTHLRHSFPTVPFVGMEPAVKPGAALTHNRKVGILATAGTFTSERYAHLTARFAQEVDVYEDPCPGLVEQIEAGHFDTPATLSLLERCLAPMLAAGVDTIVLGCTHYPFVAAEIQRLAGPGVTVIDPAPAVARQTERLLNDNGLAVKTAVPDPIQVYTSGDPERLRRLLPRFLGLSLPVEAVSWGEGDVLESRLNPRH
jgi:glutamate racemase